ncbi:lipopolysaccharide heptosyltransferase family protein [Termitidicoccus mucosus]|uniref:glycosyltransferase family 9 protein n=1 Tax=Termitidicoccus mucosus TaxID=1184151 RepID=UPI0009FF955D
MHVSLPSCLEGVWRVAPAAPFVPAHLRDRPGKILFITHLAIGDYAYLQNFFKALAGRFPHLQIHLWVDELRCTKNAAKWEGLRKYILYDWLAACPFIQKIYSQTYRPDLRAESITSARRENYPIIISLALVRPHRYAALARKIGPDSFVAGIRRFAGGLRGLVHDFSYKKLDIALPSEIRGIGHVSEIFSCWFQSLFGFGLTLRERLPFVDIPDEWTRWATGYIDTLGAAGNPLVFVNPSAKTPRRCWPMAHVVELIKAMRQQPEWRDAVFLVNALPDKIPETLALVKAGGQKRVHVFSANDNFFQLPAVLRRCALIISVETATMHLANAVRVSAVALMRKKNPEWHPLDAANSKIVTVSKRRDWIKEIPPGRVLDAMRGFPPALAE